MGLCSCLKPPEKKEQEQPMATPFERAVAGVEPASSPTEKKAPQAINKLKFGVKAIMFAQQLQKSMSDFYFRADDSQDYVVDESQDMSQVGGHAEAFVKLSGGRLAKVGDPKEMEVYPLLAKHWPKEFIPIYHGQYEDKVSGSRVILEDLTHGFKSPCIMDIKMGTESYEQDADLIKKIKLKTVDALSTTTTLGLRLVGVKLFHPKTGAVRIIGKREAMQMKNMREFLSLFCSDGEQLRRDVCRYFASVVEDLLRYFELQQKYRFVGSSLLFIYDATTKVEPKVKMIDFAHTVAIKDGVKDVGYIHGLKQLRTGFKELLEGSGEYGAMARRWEAAETLTPQDNGEFELDGYWC